MLFAYALTLETIYLSPLSLLLTWTTKGYFSFTYSEGAVVSVIVYISIAFTLSAVIGLFVTNFAIPVDAFVKTSLAPVVNENPVCGVYNVVPSPLTFLTDKL